MKQRSESTVVRTVLLLRLVAFLAVVVLLVLITARWVQSAT